MFWHDIELIIIIIISLVMIIMDVWTKDESLLLEKYIDKTEIVNKKELDITDKTLINNTILTTKGDLIDYGFQKNDYMAKKEDENDILRKAVYNKMAMNPYMNTVNTDVKLFHQTINPEKQEDVVSDASQVIEHNRMTNDMDPFKDKYQDRARGFTGLYTNARDKNTNSPSQDQRNLNYVISDAPNLNAYLETNSDDNSHPAVINLEHVNSSDEEYNYSPDTPKNQYLSRKSNDDISRQMMQTANPMRKMPPFNVDVESGTVVKARQELREHLEKTTQ